MKIPKGWRKLRKGAIIRKGDRYRSFTTKWIPTNNYHRRSTVGQWAHIETPLVYIRKIK